MGIALIPASASLTRDSKLIFLNASISFLSWEGGR